MPLDKNKLPHLPFSVLKKAISVWSWGSSKAVTTEYWLDFPDLYDQRSAITTALLFLGFIDRLGAALVPQEQLKDEAMFKRTLRAKLLSVYGPILETEDFGAVSAADLRLKFKEICSGKSHIARRKQTFFVQASGFAGLDVGVDVQIRTPRGTPPSKVHHVRKPVGSHAQGVARYGDGLKLASGGELYIAVSGASHDITDREFELIAKMLKVLKERNLSCPSDS